MKHRLFLILFAALLLCACAAKTEPAPEEAPKIISPGEKELTLTLPLGLRDEVMKTLPGYTADFIAADGEALAFSVQSADANVATGVLTSDGTLYVLAKGVGETKLTVTAEGAGSQADATVSVKVRDARRMLVLILAGVLAVALLVLLGKPVKKAPETPVVIEEPAEKTNDTDNKGEQS